MTLAKLISTTKMNAAPRCANARGLRPTQFNLARFGLQLWIPLMLLLSLQASATNLYLNGIARYDELGQAVFIGALYSENTSENSLDHLLSSAPERMEIKILKPDGITKRQFLRIWLESIAINNNLFTLNAQAENIQRFSEFFKGDLLAGDHIVISTQPPLLKLSINGVELGQLKNTEVFPMLLTCWIGKVPLSSGFSKDILESAHIDSALLAQFNQLKFSPARAHQIAGWVAPTPSHKPAAIATTAASAPPPKPSTIATPAIPSTQAAIKASPRVSAPASITSVAARTSEKFSLSNTNPLAASNSESSKLLEVETAANAQTQRLLAEQIYKAEAMDKIYRHLYYPRRARELGQTGNLNVRIVVDQNGKLLNYQLTAPSRYTMLNEALLKAVKSSEPFNSLPPTLGLNALEFELPARFDIPKS